jgi:hypothetical protein
MFFFHWDLAYGPYSRIPIQEVGLGMGVNREDKEKKRKHLITPVRYDTLK